MVNKDIQTAALIIKNGGLVAFPTETVYGLGANALNPIDVAKIFAIKVRPSFDPLIVHIASSDDIKILANRPTGLALKLADKSWPGPLTIVLPKSSIVPDIVTSGLPTVGIRMPNNEIALDLIRTSKCPIAAPSANKFGNLSPVSASHVKKQLLEKSGLIMHCINDRIPKCEKIIYASHSNNLLEIAANLFSSLHAMEDDEQIKQIFIQPVIEEGLGIAIMDRIKKAVLKYESIK